MVGWMFSIYNNDIQKECMYIIYILYKCWYNSQQWLNRLLGFRQSAKLRQILCLFFLVCLLI